MLSVANAPGQYPAINIKSLILRDFFWIACLGAYISLRKARLPQACWPDQPDPALQNFTKW
jgi:hypothetical protein